MLCWNLLHSTFYFHSSYFSYLLVKRNLGCVRRVNSWFFLFAHPRIGGEVLYTITTLGLEIILKSEGSHNLILIIGPFPPSKILAKFENCETWTICETTITFNIMPSHLHFPTLVSTMMHCSIEHSPFAWFLLLFFLCKVCSPTRGWDFHFRIKAKLTHE